MLCGPVFLPSGRIAGSAPHGSLIHPRNCDKAGTMLRVMLILCGLAVLSACDRSKINESTYKEAGAAAVLPFKKSLKAALLAGLEEGPVAAIAACRVEAPKLAEKASSPGARVGRASRKLRNPDNAPKSWMEPLLDTYETDPESREPTVVVIDDQTVGYVEPIYVQPVCVTCHGDTMAPELAEKIKELYPEDKATGYAAGDLRGVFWAELARE